MRLQKSFFPANRRSNLGNLRPGKITPQADRKAGAKLNPGMILPDRRGAAVSGMPPKGALLLENKPKANARKPRKWIPVIEVKPNIKPKRGVTLIELLIGIGIMTVVMTIASPHFRGYLLNTNLRSAAREIEADIEELKQRAITENNTFEIVFDTVANRYTIQQGGNPVEVKTPTTYSRDIRIASAPFGGGSTVAFQTRGTATAGSVNLTNSRGSMATVSINISGRTYVQFNML
jgi:type IV fimbrial biogenesis protein FimT